MPELYISSGARGGIWNFTNVSRSSGSAINISWSSGANGTLYYNWYLDTRVNSSTGANLSGATVTGSFVNGTQAFGTTTGSNGITPRQTLTEYRIDNGTYTYYTNYTVNASAPSYASNGTTINLTRNYLDGEFYITLNMSSNYLFSCGNLTMANTTYYLMNNVSANATCFNVLADNVTLDCTNHSITHATSQYGHGVNITGRDNITIRNCVMSTGGLVFTGNDYPTGILFNGSRNVTVINCTLDTVSRRGINLENTSDATVQSNIFNYQYFMQPLYVQSSNRALIRNNRFTKSNNYAQAYDYGEHKGLYLLDSVNATVTNNSFTSESWGMIAVFGTTNEHFNHSISVDNNNSGKQVLYLANLADTTVTDQNWTAYDPVIVNARNVTFSNITIDSVFFGDNVSSSVLKDSVIRPSQFVAVEAWETRNLLLLNNTWNVTIPEPAFVFVRNNINTTLANNTITTSENISAFYTGFSQGTYTLSANRIVASSGPGITSYLRFGVIDMTDNSIITSGANTSYGIRLFSYLATAKLYRNTIDSTGVSLINSLDYPASSRIIGVNDSSFNSTMNYDFQITSSTGGATNFTNVTLAHNNYSMGNSSSTVNWTVHWYLFVNATDGAGVPLSNVSINISDADATPAYSGTTDGSGTIARQTVKEFWMNGTMSDYFSNYTVNASLLGIQQSQTVNMSTNRWLTFAFDFAPNVTLQSPENGSTNNATVLFNCSAADREQLTNITLYTNASGSWQSNQTINLSQQSAWVNFTVSFTNVSMLWSCQACDNASQCTLGTNRTLTIDTNNPAIAFVTPPTPADNSTRYDTWVQVNVSTNDSSDISAFIDWNRSLIGWWSFENNSNTVPDLSTYANNVTKYNKGGADSGLSFYELGARGDGFRFFRSIDWGNGDYYITTSGNSCYYANLSCGEKTFSAWIRPEPGNTGNARGAFMGTIYPLQSTAVSGGWELRYSDNKVQFNTRVVGGPITASVTGAADYPIGEWAHVTALANNTYIALYVNGQFVGSTTYAGFNDTKVNADDRLHIGAGHNTSWLYGFNGTVDEVMAWSRFLSPAEINASYNAGLHRLERNFTGLANGTYNYTAYVIDAAGNINSTETRNVTVTTDTAPSIEEVNISPTTAYVNSTFNCSVNATDNQSSSINVSFTWYVNGSANSSWNAEVECTNNTWCSTDIYPSGIRKHYNITCSARAFDGSLYSDWANSTIITIQNAPPSNVTLIAPEDNQSVINRTPFFNWTIANDTDNDTLSYHLIVDDSATFDYPEINVTINATNYTAIEDLDLTTYFWYIQAYDNESWSLNSSVFNFTILSYLAISLPSDTVNFGLMPPNASADTLNGTVSPFVLQNDGNIPIEVFLNSSELWSTMPLNTSHFRTKVNYSEPGSFNWSGSQIAWANVTNATYLISGFNYSDQNDTAVIDIAVTVPGDEPPGNKQATITVYAST